MGENSDQQFSKNGSRCQDLGFSQNPEMNNLDHLSDGSAEQLLQSSEMNVEDRLNNDWAGQPHQPVEVNDSGRSTDGWPGQLLQQAVLYDNVDFLQCLLEGEEAANINAHDACGRTAIYTAVSNNSLRCLKLLLEHGADANLAAGGRCHNMTPLHLAVMDCKHEVLKLLLQYGSNLTPLDESGQNPLSLARTISNTNAVAMLEAEHDRRNDVLKRLSARLCRACSCGSISGTKEVLQECGAAKIQVLNMIPDHDLPPLCSASSAGSLELVQLLLENGAAPVCQRGSGLSPIHLACDAGHLPIVQLLLTEFPDLAMARSVEHRLPLHIAAAQPCMEVIQCLLNHRYPENLLQTFQHKVTKLHYKAGFDINAQDSSGKMPLHIASELGITNNIKVLLEFSLEVSPSAEPLHQEDGTVSEADAYIQHLTAKMTGAESLDSLVNASHHTLRENSVHSLYSIYSQDSSHSSGHMPSSLEEREGHIFIHPLDLNSISNEGLAPLHYAIKHHHVSATSLLLQYGADPEQTVTYMDSALSPLNFSYQHLDIDIMKLLLQSGAKDVENRILFGAFMSQDRNVASLLLQFKSVRDTNRAINKLEMRRLTTLSHCALDINLASDLESKLKLLVSPVAVQWDGLGSLNEMDMDCLVEASRRLNPSLKNLSPAVALCAITKIDISSNSFQVFPVALLSLPSLVVLNISKNKISEIPEHDDVSNCIFCPALEEIHLQGNRLTNLPSFIFRFPVLRLLDASYNKLTELPTEMWFAPCLVTLDLSSNNLSRLPHLMKDLTLRKRSSITSLPAAMSNGFSLGRQNGNSVTVSSSGSDTNIYDSSLDNVDIGLPGSFTGNEVKHINRWSASLKVIDKDPWKSNGHLTGLKQLKLSKNKFTTFPSCLPCFLPSLEVLDFSHNRLEKVGPICDLPSSLIELDLSHCGLKDLKPWRYLSEEPHETSCFAPIKVPRYPLMSASPSSHRISPGISSPPGNRDPFTSLMPVSCSHRSHFSLLHLEKLSLNNNKLEAMDLAVHTASVANSDTQSLWSLEAEEIHQRLLFPNLGELDISYNSLLTLSPDIGEMASLKVLSLRGNKNLNELPPKLGLLKQLWKLDLELCPLDGVLQDFVQNSRYPVRDILGFLLSVLEESTEYNCLNLMLVGCQKIGKTSLLNKLRKEGRSPTKPTFQNSLLPTPVYTMTRFEKVRHLFPFQSEMIVRGFLLLWQRHWRDRLEPEKEITQYNGTLSTVGIDINELILDCGKKTSITFRTWDFGGQREYYATHQYFLSPRSLYLVMWSIIDGESGVEGLQQWLINIQARAPGASVIIVGTHLDVLRDKATRRNFPQDFEEAMVGMVEKLFLRNQEPDKCGLPNVLDMVNISCKTGENVKKLVEVIKRNAMELRHPKSRTVKLLGQKIPRKYLLLQKIIRELALKRLSDFKDPVLTRSNYMLCVSEYMMEKGFTTFRDVEELEQATRFLHENGVLFHWEDPPALRDMYFLDPQWLCDQLAKVVTVREINNFAQRGVMHISNMEFLFRKSTFQPDYISQYITSLLAKFEVALQFDEEHLLLPSLLPAQHDHDIQGNQADALIPMRKPSSKRDSTDYIQYRVPERRESAWASHLIRTRANSRPEELHVGSSVFYAGSLSNREVSRPSIPDLQNLLLLAVKPCSNPIFSFCRLYFMMYFPSGFWSRLIVRVLADESLYPVVKNLFQLPEDLMNRSPEICELRNREPEWHCWQTGMELFYFGFEMLRVREVTLSSDLGKNLCDYNQCRIKCSVDKEWCFLDMVNSRILEITFPTDLLRFHVSRRDGSSFQTLDLTNTTTVVREEQATTKLLVKIVEHIDILLQDWYPELGEIRFDQNVKGRYLVTRVVPCPLCLAKEVRRQKVSRAEEDSWYFVNLEAASSCVQLVLPPVSSRDGLVHALSLQERNADENYEILPGTSSKKRTLSEGQAFIYNRDNSRDGTDPVIYSFLVERCMLDVLQGVDAVCPVHGSISPQLMLDGDGIAHNFNIAPDVVFNDMPFEVRISYSDHLEVGQCLGEGNFGKVYEGKLFRKGEGPPQHVALKILFEADRSRKATHLPFQNRLEAACNAYLTARQEVSILEHLSHPHIVPFLGLALHPLSLVLGLAPHGSLNSLLKQFHTAGRHLPLFAVRQVLLQVAKGLAYLHLNKVIYRDLKSENVLVWDFPLSVDAQPDALIVVKIADYGISRTVQPNGAKGFGGTPPFIAPEIIQLAGKGTYTEKVDIFSFGMFMFEIVTCRFPFSDQNNVNSLICQGGRPSLTIQEVHRYPTFFYDLLVACWSHDPAERPSAASIVDIVNSPQFCHMRDTLSLGPDVGIFCGISVPAAELMIKPQAVDDSPSSTEMYTQIRHSQVWLSSSTSGSCNALEIFSLDHGANTVIDHKTLQLPSASITAMCLVDSSVWCADMNGVIHIYDINLLTLVHELELPVHSTITVLSLHLLPGNQGVLAVTSCSDRSFIFVCPHPRFGPIKTEAVAESFRVFRCFSSALLKFEDRCELWLGQGSGSILVWDTLSQTSVHCLYHAVEKLPPSTCCIYLVAGCSNGSKLQVPFVWTYNFPGTVVYCWDAVKRCIVDQLDCSAIFSTTTGTGGLHFEGQITALNVADQYLYIGNTRGRIIVVDALSMKPLCIFPAHSEREFYVRCILPVLQQDSSFEDRGSSKSQGIVTVGRGFANMLSINKSDNRNESKCTSTFEKTPDPLDGYAHHTFFLLWSTEHWEYY